jgi:ABC-type transporter Mla subunit MlaD
MVARKHNFTSTEVRAGVLAVVAAIAIGTFVFVIGEFDPFPEEPALEVWFQDTKGLNKGADVRYGGKLVGRVAEIRVEEVSQQALDEVARLLIDPEDPGFEAPIRSDGGTVPRIVVSVLLDEDIPINRASSAFITNTTLTSDKHLEITTDWSTEPTFQYDGITVLPVNEGDLFGMAGELLGTLSEEISGIGDLLGVDSDAELTSVADLLMTLNDAMKQSETLIVNTNDLVDANRDEIDRIIANVLEIEESANAVLQEVNGTIKEARPLVTDSLERVPPLLDQFTVVSQELEQLLQDLEPVLAQAESVAANTNGLIEDAGPEVTDLVTDIRETVQNLNDLILMLRENPTSLVRGRPKGRRSAGND